MEPLFSLVARQQPPTSLETTALQKAFKLYFLRMKNGEKWRMKSEGTLKPILPISKENSFLNISILSQQFALPHKQRFQRLI